MTVDDYMEAEAAWVKEVGLKVGDRVLIVSSANDEQCGWANNWLGPEDAMDDDNMDEAIGCKGTVQHIPTDGTGISINVDKDSVSIWRYPFFVLVKLEE